LKLNKPRGLQTFQHHQPNRTKLVHGAASTEKNQVLFRLKELEKKIGIESLKKIRCIASPEPRGWGSSENDFVGVERGRTYAWFRALLRRSIHICWAGYRRMPRNKMSALQVFFQRVGNRSEITHLVWAQAY